MRKKLLLLSVLAVLFPAVRAQSLEECRQAAEQNYPIIRQYDLIARTTELTVRNIQKAWFPQISVTAQGSYQNKVTAWPENLQGLFAQMGIQLQGLSRDQYKVGIDVRQTLFDGGAIGSRREIARGEGAVQAAQTEVDLYKIGQRVHEMYFGLLLLDEQLRLNADVNALLRSNEAQLAAMLKNGTASAGDFENVKAERLSAEQQQTELLSQRQTLQRLLSLFVGSRSTAFAGLPCPICRRARTNARSFNSSTADFNSPMRKKKPSTPNSCRNLGSLHKAITAIRA